MQRSWRTDADKLTFIVCLPLLLPRRREDGHDSSSSDNANNDSNEDHGGDDKQQYQEQKNPNSVSISMSPMTITEQDDSPDRMLGDVNLFLRFDDDNDVDDNDAEAQAQARKIVGEIELMIAEKQNQRRGFGRAALLSFLRYIIEHESDIVAEFLLSQSQSQSQQHQQQQHQEQQRKHPLANNKLSCLSVKIHQSNVRSLKLFESLSFRKVSSEPNYFGEFELRRTDLHRGEICDTLKKSGIDGYVELHYYSNNNRE